MPIRTELAVIGVPRDSPDDDEYDDVLTRWVPVDPDGGP